MFAKNNDNVRKKKDAIPRKIDVTWRNNDPIPMNNEWLSFKTRMFSINNDDSRGNNKLNHWIITIFETIMNVLIKIMKQFNEC